MPTALAQEEQEKKVRALALAAKLGVEASVIQALVDRRVIKV